MQMIRVARQDRGLFGLGLALVSCCVERNRCPVFAKLPENINCRRIRDVSGWVPPEATFLGAYLVESHRAAGSRWPLQLQDAFAFRDIEF